MSDYDGITFIFEDFSGKECAIVAETLEEAEEVANSWLGSDDHSHPKPRFTGKQFNETHIKEPWRYS